MPSNQPAARVTPSGEQAPYVGPRPFTTNDRDVFFGRNQEAIELTSLVKAHPELLLYAQSGAGKTSLLFAQVIPILDTEEDFDVLPPARVRSQESSRIPDEKIGNIYMFNALKDLSDDQLSVIERSQFTLAEYLKRRPRSAVRPTEGAAGNGNDGSPELRLPRVVIFDQFEEIFTLHPERYKDRQDFFMQVAEALKDDPFLRVVFSMREDYIAEVDPYVDILPQSLRTRFRLERLRNANAVSAVKQPLEAERVRNTGRKFADGAAETLVEKLMLIKVKTASGDKIEVPGEFVDPVQLQVVCQTLWDKLPPDKKIITKEDIDKYANVDEALSDFYETSVRKAVIASNNAIQAGRMLISGETLTITEGAVRGWFEQRLITREGKRNMVFREAHSTAGLSNLVIDELENQHVIRVEMRGGEPWYELSHDRFIPPIRESNKRFLLKQPLARRKAQELEGQADEWLKSGRKKKYLLNRAQLPAAQSWMKTDGEAVGYTETLFGFIRASEVAIEHEDNEQQQLLAKAQAERAELERQRARQMKFGLMIASVLLLFTLGSTGLAINRWFKANTAQATAWDYADRARKALDKETAASIQARYEKAKAEDVAKKLQVANDLAETKKKEAEKAGQNAEAARVVAEHEKIAAQNARKDTERALKDATAANEQLKGFATELQRGEDKLLSLKLATDAAVAKDPELSLRLALEAVERADTGPAAYMLRTSYLKWKQRSVLEGHKGIVWQVAYSSDGHKIITGGEDGTVRIWDVATGTSKTLTNPIDSQKGSAAPAVHAFAISPDASRVATEVFDGTGRLWDVATEKSIILPGLSGPVPVVAFSPNGKLVGTEFTTDEKKPGATPRIWNALTGQLVATLSHTDSTSALAFNPAGDLVASASWDKTAKIWRAETGELLKVLTGHTDKLSSIIFSPDGKWVATGSDDGTAKLWDVQTGQLLRTFSGHLGAVHDLCFSADGKLIAAAGGSIPPRQAEAADVDSSDEVQDNTVMVWETAKEGKLVGILSGHTGPINNVQFSSAKNKSRLIVTASEDGTARVWAVETGKIVNELRRSEAAIKSAAFSSDNRSVVTAGADGVVQVWPIVDPSKISQFSVRSGIRDVRFGSNGNSLIAALMDGSVREFSLTGGPKRVNQFGSSGSVNDIAQSPDGRFLVATGTRVIRQSSAPASPKTKTNTGARVWDTVNKGLVAELPTEGTVFRVAYSPKGNYVLTVTEYGVAQVWQTSDWKLNLTMTAENKRGTLKVLAGAFDPNEKYVATAVSTGLVCIWDLSTGLQTRVIKVQKEVGSLSFSSDGELLVTAGYDGIARVWTVDGKLISLLAGHDGDVNSAKFSRDGNFVVTAGSDGTVRVWETRTGARVLELKESGSYMITAAFSPDNQTIVASDGDRTIYLYDCQVCRPIEQMKTMANESKPRPLTEDERKTYLGEEKGP